MAEQQQTAQTQRDLLVLIREKQERMGNDIVEIKETMKDLGECQREFQLTYTQEHQKVLADVKHTGLRLDEFMLWKLEAEKKIASMEKMWERQAVMNAIMAFVATVLGGAVITYIWGMIVH